LILYFYKKTNKKYKTNLDEIIAWNKKKYFENLNFLDKKYLKNIV